MYRSSSKGERSKGSMVGPNQQNGHSYLEQENEELIGDFSKKVNTLKHLSIEIGHEVKKQNDFLSQLGTNFENTGSLLGNSMRRLGLISSSGGPKLLCYLVMFAFFVFLTIYYLIRRAA